MQTVNDTGYAPRGRCACKRNAVTHGVAHTDFNGNIRLVRKLHKRVYKRNDEAVEIGTGQILQMATGRNARLKRLLHNAEIMFKRLFSRHVEFFENVIIGTADENTRFFNPDIVHKLEILFLGANPRRDLGEFIPKRHTLFKRFAIFFRIYEKFTLTDNPVRTAKARKQFINIYDLFRRIRRAGLLTVTKRRVRNPNMFGRVHRHAAMVKRRFRNFVIRINITEQLRLCYVLQIVFILVHFQQVAHRI